MDAQPTLTEALAIASLLRATARYLQDTRGDPQAGRPLSPVFWWSLKDNCFTASRFGIDAKLIINKKGDVMPMREVADDLLERIAPYTDCAERLYLNGLRERLAQGLPYLRQRTTHKENGSLHEVVRRLVYDLSSDVV